MKTEPPHHGSRTDGTDNVAELLCFTKTDTKKKEAAYGLSKTAGK